MGQQLGALHINREGTAGRLGTILVLYLALFSLSSTTYLHHAQTSRCHLKSDCEERLCLGSETFSIYEGVYNQLTCGEVQCAQRLLRQ